LKQVLLALFAVILALVLVAPAAVAAEAPPQAARQLTSAHGLLGLAAALAVAFGALGTAWAQSRIGAAAAGAMAERPELGGLMFAFLALPETLIILGFVVALQILGKI
jgi:V/A-type H+-transporting ATPase subunit K